MPPESPIKLNLCDSGGGGVGVNVERNCVLIMGHPEHSNETVSSSSAHAATAASSDPVLFVDDQFSPGISWLGAEVQVENKISRRCSYEEMVHEDHEEVLMPELSDKCIGDADDQQQGIWYQAVLRVTQWAITLQEINDERLTMGHHPVTHKCLCHKASNIGQKLNHLTSFMLQLSEARDDDTDGSIDLIQVVDDVQSALRAGVSIQISKPSEAVMTKAVSVVDAAMASCQRTDYVRSAIDSIIKLVDALLNVPTCGHASNSNLLDDSDRIRDVSPTRLMEQDEEEDIRSRVASMFQNDEESDDEEEDMETGSGSPRSARKRKQLKHGKSPTSPTSSPSKRPRKLNKNTASSSVFSTPTTANPGPGASMIMSAPAKICQSSPALDLLESKKKVQRNSLYHWVLWREALRGEKDRATTSSPTSSGSSINRSRLAFN